MTEHEKAVWLAVFAARFEYHDRNGDLVRAVDDALDDGVVDAAEAEALERQLFALGQRLERWRRGLR